MNQPTSNRDPVCGMSVNPETANYHYEHQGTTWHFCAKNCLEQFQADPSRYRPKPTPVGPRPKSVSIGKELLATSGIFLAVVVVIIMARGIAKQSAGQTTQATATGVSAGQHQAVDDGSAGVIVSAAHEQGGEFTVSLNTHTVDLSGFTALKQVRLHDGDQEFTPQTVDNGGGTSTHHQNYRLSFADNPDGSVWVGVHDVGGVAVRRLPFNL